MIAPSPRMGVYARLCGISQTRSVCPNWGPHRTAGPVRQPVGLYPACPVRVTIAILAEETPSPERLSALRYLLKRRDPIGVYHEPLNFPPDEYDGLLGPLLIGLARRESRAALSEYLWHDVEENFGLALARCGTANSADKFLAWYAPSTTLASTTNASSSAADRVQAGALRPAGADSRPGREVHGQAAGPGASSASTRSPSDPGPAARAFPWTPASRHVRTACVASLLLG